jgi:hypothetical protein
MDYLDVYRRESQRDFADGGGVLSRALVEGLFGVKPDLLAGELRVAPGFPAGWERASLRHPDLSVGYERTGRTERFSIESRFEKPVTLRLEVTARGNDARVTVNNRRANWRWLDRAAPRSHIEVLGPPGARAVEVVVTWTGAPPSSIETALPIGPSAAHDTRVARDWRTPLPVDTRWETVDLAPQFNDRVTQIFRNEYRTPRSPFVSLALPKQGIGAWAGHVNATADIDDRGLRAAARAHGGRFVLPNGVPFATPGSDEASNVVFTSQWDNYPRAATVPLAGRARHVYLLMAGSTNHMQSRLDNGEVVVTYADGTTTRLALHNPTTWWPIDQDYFIDDFQFHRPEPIPPRVDLKTGTVRLLDEAAFKGRGGSVPGGAATVLDLPLDPARELRSLSVRTLANEVVIGLMAATLER